MTNPNIRKATREDWLAFFGEPPKNSSRAIVGEVDGEIVGICGLRYNDGFMTAFSCLNDKGARYKFSIMKAGKMLLEMFKEHPGIIVALADPDIPTSSRFLERLGFMFMHDSEEGRVYRWHGSP
jgi:hypothetical protein